MEDRRYYEVWGDTVDLRELAFSAVIGTVLALGLYLLGVSFLRAYSQSLETGLLKGYSLLVGVIGVILAGVISAKLFKPKREVLVEAFSKQDIADSLGAVLAELELSSEEEQGALNSIEERLKKEMEELGLYTLLSSGLSRR